MNLVFGIFIVIHILSNHNSNACKINGTLPGTCIALRECQPVLDDLENRIRPTLCSADTQDEPLVCCPNDDTSKTRISETKCKEYSDAFMRTISVSPLLYKPSKTNISLELCEKHGAQLIVGGTVAEPAEFPHMAAIGWQLQKGVQWLCGGSIISERYILTAAHCRARNEGVEASLVRCGTIKLAGPDDSYMDFKIEKFLIHPSYTIKYHYNDIGLIRVEGTILFDKFIRPACLWLDPATTISTATASGWGLTAFQGEASNQLLKVRLEHFDNSVCNASYSVAKLRRLNQGIIESQLCAGDNSGKKDTCQGDSGAPLQITLTNNQCIYYIVGITSFGRACALSSSPGVYTRVTSYLDWVEGIVWS